MENITLIDANKPEKLKEAINELIDANKAGHTKEDVGLGNVDNTPDIDKPVSTPTAEFVATEIKNYHNTINTPLLEKKLNKIEGVSDTSAYIVTSEGENSVKQISQEAIPETLMERNNAGQTHVSTPTEGTHAANKDYVDERFNGASKPYTYDNYPDMITAFNKATKEEFLKGRDVHIVQTGIPDLWIAYIQETSIEYSYVSDEKFVEELLESGTVQVGYYKLGYLETTKFDPTGYIKNTDYGSSEKAGIFKLGSGIGISKNTSNELYVVTASEAEIEAKTQNYKPLAPKTIDKAVVVGLTTNKYTLTEEQQAIIKSWLGINKEIQNISSLNTIYNDFSELPTLDSSMNGTRYVTKTNGALPLKIYDWWYDTQEWKLVDVVRGSALYIVLDTGLVYRYRSIAPYLFPSSYTKISELEDDVGLITINQVPTIQRVGG